MPKNYIMALDQGTTSSRCIVFDRAGKPVSSASREFPQIFPRAGWVEHDPMSIWSSQLSSATEALARAGISPDEIHAVGVTNQRETTLLWRRSTGEPISNAIVWQCRRTSDMVDALPPALAERIRAVTGLIPDAYFSATKIRWLLDNIPAARALAEAGDLCFGTVDTWLVWQLTGGAAHATDVTNASRTMLFDIETLDWSDELLAAFDVPRSILPAVHPSSHIFGATRADVLGAEIPIAAAAGDQHAALFGQCCFEAGDVKNTYGTGCFMLMNTGASPARSSHGLLTTVAYALDGTVEYALEGSVFSAGSAVQWLRDELRVIDAAADSEALAASVPDTAGAYFVPAFTGLGAPHWNQHARGALLGITRGCGRAHITRAVLESIAYQTRDVLDAMERDARTAITSLRADGGASVNNFLMQFQADIINRPVLRPAVSETTALGAAYLAGLASGFWCGRDELRSFAATGREFLPSMPPDTRASLLDGWHSAVRRVL